MGSMKELLKKYREYKNRNKECTCIYNSVSTLDIFIHETSCPQAYLLLKTDVGDFLEWLDKNTK